MQCELGEDKAIRIILDNEEIPVEVHCKRNWIQSVIQCQKLDEGGYGGIFTKIPKFSSNETDTRLLWLLSGMLLCVKELWCITDKCDKMVSRWNGWLLCYLTKKCFPEIITIDDKNNPFKKRYVASIK